MNLTFKKEFLQCDDADREQTSSHIYTYLNDHKLLGNGFNHTIKLKGRVNYKCMDYEIEYEDECCKLNIQDV